ncbi:hypothetical protein [Micromonospora sp. WMMD987]|jgi:hypothetical protein|uniref:hypothetical protein n=1 Tax=Micromonospora TaxID=1873 RepID=UPI00249B23D4|nr:hypothetical protein [Micromonospora sp. WMMD987]WFE95351.1 hypothetical protein O7612_29380 [Micromonospora sp. WMMD987]
MDESRQPAKIQETLTNITQGRPSQDLVFDPRTGQLSVSSNPSPDDVVATNTAADGYFG